MFFVFVLPPGSQLSPLCWKSFSKMPIVELPFSANSRLRFDAVRQGFSGGLTSIVHERILGASFSRAASEVDGWLDSNAAKRLESAGELVCSWLTLSARRSLLVCIDCAGDIVDVACTIHEPRRSVGSFNGR